MIRISYGTMVGALLMLSLLWIVNGCSQTSVRSLPPPQDRPLEVQSPAPAGKETVRPTPPREEPAKPAPHFYVHVVRWQNETLSFIAEWYTASWKNWQALARANPEVDPNRIRIGDEIRIPEVLLKTRKPMPPDFLPKEVSKKAVQPAAPRQEPIEKPDRVRGPEVGETRDTPSAPLKEAVLFVPEEAQPQPILVSEEMELFEPAEIAGKPAEIPEEAGLFGPVE